MTISTRRVLPDAGPVVGAEFSGTNRTPIVRRRLGLCAIGMFEPGRCFAFEVGGDRARPDSIWEYAFDPADGGGTRVMDRGEMVREARIVLVC